MFIDNQTFVTSFSCSLVAPRWGLPWSPRERHPPGNPSSAVYNRMSVCIGLSRYDGGRWRLPLSSKFPSAISNLTFLTYPSSLGNTCTTLQSGHLLRVLSLSLEMTISPTARFLLGWTHFCLTCNIWRYSPLHLSQNSFAKYWTPTSATLYRLFETFLVAVALFQVA